MDSRNGNKKICIGKSNVNCTRFYFTRENVKLLSSDTDECTKHGLRAHFCTIASITNHLSVLHTNTQQQSSTLLHTLVLSVFRFLVRTRRSSAIVPESYTQNLSFRYRCRVLLSYEIPDDAMSSTDVFVLYSPRAFHGTAKFFLHHTDPIYTRTTRRFRALRPSLVFAFPR